MTKRKFLTISLSLIFMNILVLGQNPNRIYDIDDWITYKNCNYVTSLCETPEYVYFGTSGGIIPYHKFKRCFEDPITRSNGLSGDIIKSICYDWTTGYLWVVHENGISYRNPSDRRWNNLPFTSIGITQPSNLLRIGSDGAYIWVQINGNEYIKLDKFVGYRLGKEIPHDSVHWSISSADYFRDYSAYTVDGNYQCYSDGMVVDPLFRKYSISVFYVASDGKIYGGLTGGGIIIGDENTKFLSIKQLGPLNNNVTTVAVGRDRIFLGSSESTGYLFSQRTGVSSFDLNGYVWEYFESGYIFELADKIVNKICFNGESLVIGTSQGVVVYEIPSGLWDIEFLDKYLPDQKVISLAFNDSLVFAGTEYGLLAFSLPYLKLEERISTIPVYTNVLDMVINQNDLWIATSNGIYLINTSTGEMSHYDMYFKRIDNDDIVAFSVDAIEYSNGRVFYNRRQDLYLYNIENNKVVDLPTISSNKNLIILDMKVYDNYLCVATNDGIFMINLEDNYYEHLTIDDGIGGELVYEVCFYNDYLWLATNNGLTKFNWRKYYD